MIDQEKIKQALLEVIDPEIGIDVINLGLIYEIKIEEDNVFVKMTLTMPGCPLASHILEQVKNKIKSIEGVKDANIQLVFDPPWNPTMMSDELKQKFGFTK